MVYIIMHIMTVCAFILFVQNDSLYIFAFACICNWIFVLYLMFINARGRRQVTFGHIDIYIFWKGLVYRFIKYSQNKSQIFTYNFIAYSQHVHKIQHIILISKNPLIFFTQYMNVADVHCFIPCSILVCILLSLLFPEIIPYMQLCTLYHLGY